MSPSKYRTSKGLQVLTPQTERICWGRAMKKRQSTRRKKMQQS